MQPTPVPGQQQISQSVSWDPHSGAGREGWRSTRPGTPALPSAPSPSLTSTSARRARVWGGGGAVAAVGVGGGSRGRAAVKGSGSGSQMWESGSGVGSSRSQPAERSPRPMVTQCSVSISHGRCGCQLQCNVLLLHTSGVSATISGTPAAPLTASPAPLHNVNNPLNSPLIPASEINDGKITAHQQTVVNKTSKLSGRKTNIFKTFSCRLCCRTPLGHLCNIWQNELRLLTNLSARQPRWWQLM